METVFDPFSVSGSIILGNKYRHGMTAAVSEGVGESLNPHSGRIGGDSGGSQRIYGSLHQNFTNIKTGLLERAGNSIMEGFCEQFPVESEISAPAQKIWN